MKLETDGGGRLTVTNSEVFFAVLAAGFVCAAAAVWFGDASAGRTAAASGGFALLALATAAGAERSRFVFDPARRRIVWERSTPFRRQAGELPFEAVHGVSLEAGFTDSGRRSNARRLVLLTRDGPLPLTLAYGGARRRLEAAGAAIQAVLRAPGGGGADVPFTT